MNFQSFNKLASIIRRIIIMWHVELYYILYIIVYMRADDTKVLLILSCHQQKLVRTLNLTRAMKLIFKKKLLTLTHTHKYFAVF